VPLNVLEQQLKITQRIRKNISMNREVKKRHLAGGFRNFGQEIIDSNRIPVTSESVDALACPPPPPEDWVLMNSWNDIEVNSEQCEDIKEKIKGFGAALVISIEFT
jgi:hypothetical protein